jgi:hypothetical protein
MHAGVVQARADGGRGGGRAHGQLRRSGAAQTAGPPDPDTPFAAYATLVGLFPSRADDFALQM